MFKIILKFIEMAMENEIFNGVLINALCALISYPFNSKFLKKILKNRKKSRIKNAQQEFLTECVEKLVDKCNWPKKKLEAILVTTAVKYKLEADEIFPNNDIFTRSIIEKIESNNFIGSGKKEQLVAYILENKLFENRNSEISKITIESNINFKEGCSKREETSENTYLKSEEVFKTFNVELNKEELKSVRKVSLLFSIIVFVFLMLLYVITRVLFSVYGVGSVAFINATITIIAIIPIFYNGALYFNEFNEQNQKMFGMLVIIFLLNIITFITIAITFLNK